MHANDGDSFFYNADMPKNKLTARVHFLGVSGSFGCSAPPLALHGASPTPRPLPPRQAHAPPAQARAWAARPGGWGKAPPARHPACRYRPLKHGPAPPGFQPGAAAGEGRTGGPPAGGGRQAASPEPRRRTATGSPCNGHGNAEAFLPARGDARLSPYGLETRAVPGERGPAAPHGPEGFALSAETAPRFPPPAAR